MIVVIVKAKVSPGRHASLRQIAAVLQHEYAPHEEGCEQYEAFIDGDAFVMIERWRSHALLERHMQAAHFVKLVPQLKACLVDELLDVQLIETEGIQFLKA